MPAPPRWRRRDRRHPRLRPPLSWVKDGTRAVVAADGFHNRILHALENIFGRHARAIKASGAEPHIAPETRGGLLAFAPAAVPAPNAINDFIMLQATVIVFLLILLSSAAAPRSPRH